MKCEHCGRNVPEHLIHTPTREDFRGRPQCRWTARRAVKSEVEDRWAWKKRQRALRRAQRIGLEVLEGK